MPKSEVILAIIRQESEFDKSANSWAGARGMMQLMKYTAKVVAKQAKLPYSISGLTRDPEYNIKLGSYYFNSLIEEYNGVIDSSKISWVNNCEFILTKLNPRTNQEKRPVKVKILRTYEDSYDFEYSNINEPILIRRGKVKRIND